MKVRRSLLTSWFSSTSWITKRLRNRIRCAQHRLDQPGSLSFVDAHARAGDANRGDNLSRSIPNRGRDTSQTLLQLFSIERNTTLADHAQLRAEHLRIADGVLCKAR